MKVSVIGCSTTWSDRPTSSYCINDEILVDAGEGTFKYYKKAGVDFENIKHIFVTHMHADHTFAVINHIYNSVWHYNRNQIKPLYVYGPKGIKQYFKSLVDVTMPEYKDMDMSEFLHIKEIDNFDTELRVEGLKVKFFKLVHGELEDIGYVFDDGVSKVGFSGDCTYTKELDGFVNQSDTLFLECCGMKTNDKHLGYDLYSNYAKKYPNKNFYAIHCENNVYNDAKKLKIKTAEAGKTYQIKNHEKTL